MSHGVISWRSPMKKLAIAVLCSLSLSACPMTNNTGSTTQNPAKPSQADCSLLVELEGPEPVVQPWDGQLQEGSSTSAWVLSTVDDKDPKWLLMLVEVDKRAVTAAYLLTNDEERIDAIGKVSEMQRRIPNLFLAILGGVRPFPQPGPPGEPGEWILRQALSTAVAERRIRNELGGLMQQQPGK
jgi:hypothetical protein